MEELIPKNFFFYFLLRFQIGNKVEFNTFDLLLHITYNINKFSNDNKQDKNDKDSPTCFKCDSVNHYTRGGINIVIFAIMIFVKIKI